MSRILITGGSGFIGSNLVEHFSRAGHEVLNLDLRPPRNPAAAAQFTSMDILNRPGLAAAASGFDPQYIFHLAARTDLEGANAGDYAANVEGVRNAVAAGVSAPSLRRMIFFSSMYVCRLGHVPHHDGEYCPHTAYGHSKVLGEQIVRREAGDRFCWTLVRPTSIWGPWFGVPYLSFFHAVRKGLYVHPKGYRIQRSYGFVLNTVWQLRQLIEYADSGRVHGKVFYLADYEPVDTLQWARAIAENFRACKVREAPLALLRVAAIVGDVLKRMGITTPPLSSVRLNNLLTNAVFDLRPIREIGGEQPYTLAEGIAITVDWMRRHAPKAGIAAGPIASRIALASRQKRIG